MAPPSPPGPLVQYMNAISHDEPFMTLLHLLVFVPLIALATPIGLVGIFLYGAIRWYMAYTISPVSPGPHLAVVITGCDSGFGRELAMAAVDAGYTVFAGCLTPSTSWSGPISPRLIPLAMDVTNDGQVQDAVRVVEQWLSAADDDDDDDVTTKPPPPRRLLHALVNNAGVGGIGLIDWMDLQFYELCMNVNYLGLVRCCKAFLPIFKRQIDRNCRIINLTSIAGLIHGHQTWSAYMASKHAANAFSHVLRAETRAYVQVTTVNPSFHATAIVHNLQAVAARVWSNLDDTTRHQYGQDYFDSVYQYCYERPYRLAWDMKVPVQQLQLLLSKGYLWPELYVGLDARFLHAPLLPLPLWLSEHLVRLGNLGMKDPAFVVAAAETKQQQKK